VLAPAVQVAIQDAAGYTVITATNAVTLGIGTNPAGGTLSGTLTVSAVNGVASFSTLSIGKAGTDYTLVASAAGLTGATSAAFNITVGSATNLGFTVQPSDALAGQVLTPAVQVAIQDAAGNTVTAATNAVTLAIGANPVGGTLSGILTVSAVNGVANFSSLNIGKAANGYTLVASAAGLTGATSAAFNITVGSATKLGFTVQPSGALARQVLSPAIQVAIQDAVGNTVTGATNSVTLAIGANPGGGTLSGTLTASAVNGVATFSTLSIDKAGNGYTLVASATGLSGATSAGFSIVLELVFTVQPPNGVGAVAGKVLAPAVQVAIQDALGNTVTTATSAITLAIGTNPVGGTLSGTLAVSAVSGVATFSTLSIDKEGAGYTLVASAAGLTGATSAAFAIVPLFQSISAGEQSTCGVTSAGTAYCWGDNIYGELGNGTTNSSTTPVAVSGGLTFQAISVSGNTCGVTTAGAAYCWGFGTTISTTPVAVSGGLTFRSISAGTFHSCGVTTAGAAYCWGDNTAGELGNGTTTSSMAPVAVSGSLTFQSVSAGTYYTCGRTSAGAAYCWGDNRYGELGNGTAIIGPTSAPVAVSGGLTFQSISAGFQHACGVTTAGAAYCWGSNTSGELGNGATTNSTVPTAVSGGLTLQSVSAGGFASGGGQFYVDQQFTCGLTTGGMAYCWGDNTFGKLGNGTTTSSTTPVAVSGGLTFQSISPGWGYACGVTSAGAYCWGDNGAGEFGTGTRTSSPVPVGPI
jgi:alpha-tubulin suppressor-like RCC1 family protein